MNDDVYLEEPMNPHDSSTRRLDADVDIPVRRTGPGPRRASRVVFPLALDPAGRGC